MTLKLKLNSLVPILLASALPFANITKIFGIEDGFSILVIIVALILGIKHSYNRQKIILNYFSIILIFSLIGMIFNYFNNSIPGEVFYAQLVKIGFFVLLGSNTVNPKSFKIFLLKYHKIFIISLLISIFLYFLFPLEEFVFYDGSANRFSGLHFELYNFLYSTVLFYVSWLFAKRNKKYGLLLLILFALISKSNILILYLIAYIVSFYFYKLFYNKYFFFISFAFILISPLLIGFFLNFLEIINIFSIRNASSFDHSGSSIYIRLYPFSIGADYLNSHSLIHNLLPKGLGYFENTSLIKDDKFSFGGTGSPKAIIDIGIILFILLSFYIIKLGYKNYISKRFIDKRKYLFLFLTSLIFIAYGAGFFNIVAWYVIMNLTLQHKNILLTKNNLK